jgi:serine/threonine-protein phosphatase 2A regulatory subunit A
MASDKNYLHRVSVLYCLRDLCSTASTNDIRTVIVPAFLRAAQDRVANIRFVTAKVLQSLQPKIDASDSRSVVVPCLQTLAEDSDTDVRFYAQRALRAYQKDVAMAESS